MASVQKRPGRPKTDPRYDVRYRDPSRRVRTRSFTRKVDAETFAAAVETDLGRGDWIDPGRGRVTFGEWAARWLATSPHLKPRTRAGYESILSRHLLPRLETSPVAGIDRGEVKRIVGELSESNGAGTVRNAYNVLRAVFGAAIDGGALRSNPCDRVRVPAGKRDEMLFLDADQVATLADTIDPRYRTLVLLGAYTGMRAGEIAALQVGRLDLMVGSAEVSEAYAEVHGALVLGATKTYAIRTVRLPRFLCDLLALEVADRAKDPAALVFTDSVGGPIRQSNFYRRTFKPAVHAAVDVPDGLRFHDLRHTAVALLIAQGAHPRAIMERVGHSSVSVTLDRYGHLLPAVDEALTEGLESTYASARSSVGVGRPRDIRAMESA